MLGMALFMSLALLAAYTLTVWLVIRRLRRPPRRTAAWAVSRNLPTSPAELSLPRAFESFALKLDPLFPRHEQEVWDIAGDDPRAPIIIITPGWGDSRLTMLDRIAALAPLAARLLVWDPPGHGDSPGLCPLGTREPAMIRALAQHAARAYPTNDIVLYGFSLGAGASIVAAAEWRAATVPSVARHSVPGLPSSPPLPAVHLPHPALRAVIAEAPYRLPWTPARNVLRHAGLPIGPILPMVFVLLGLRLGVGPRWSRAHSGVGFDRAAHATRLAPPLLVLHGSSDEICPLADGEAIAAAAPRGRCATIHAAGHLTMFSADATRGPALERVRHALTADKLHA